MRITDTAFIAAAALLSVAAVALVWNPAASDRTPVRRPSGSKGDEKRVLLTSYLPVGYDKGGRVDYAQAFTDAALSAAGGTLVLPDFPIRVAPQPGDNHAVRILKGLTIEGAHDSRVIVYERGIQALRFEDVENLDLRRFTVAGPGGDGRGLGHGLVQVTGGRDIRIEALTVLDGDANGIAVAGAEDVTIENCRLEANSKSSIYVSGSRRVRVTDNTISDFGGHLASSGGPIGAGIQLSSNAEAVCSGNLIDGGTGSGILCNALVGGAAPTGTLIDGNRIRGATNAGNMQASSGVRLANSAQEKRARTVVTGNSIEACGVYGLIVENHDGCVIRGNTISDSARSGIVVGTVNGAFVLDNVLIDAGTEELSGQDAIQLINRATDVTVAGNDFLRSGGWQSRLAHARVRDRSRGEGHTIVPRRLAAEGPPTTGQWYQGDVLLDPTPEASGPVGWVCHATGIPGSWRPFGAD